MSAASPPSDPLTIVLTGVSRGLGRALVPEFAGRGHRVVGCARSSEDLAALREEFPDHHFMTVDVSDAGAVNDWARATLDVVGAPDLLINNAAIQVDLAPLWEVPAEDMHDILSVNVAGTASVVRSFVPAMIDNGAGVIVNLSSGWGRSTSPDVGPYCTSKWAIEGYTRTLAQELPRGLAAVSLNPGIIDTYMLRQCWAEGASAYEGAESWASRAAPFLLALDASDNGAIMTAP